MQKNNTFHRKKVLPASLNGQRIGAACKIVNAFMHLLFYGARKTRNCEKPGFCRRQKWPKKKKQKKVTTRRIVTLKDVNLDTKEETLKYTQIKLN